jgi:hypothetical protein
MRQLAAEQFALDVAGEIPAIAGLPSPWFADQRREESSAIHIPTIPQCPLVQLPAVQNDHYPEMMSRSDIYFRLSLIWLATLLVGALMLLRACTL